MTLHGVNQQVGYSSQKLKKEIDVTFLCVSSIGLIATACGDDMIRIFKECDDSAINQPTFELILAQHHAHTQDVNTVKWCPHTAGLLLSTSDDGEVKIWKFTE